MRKVIVLGGSAGGIEAFCEVLKGLPADLAAPLLAVIHMAPGETLLPLVLRRASQLEIVDPIEAQPLTSGRVYVARPDRHLVVRDGCVLTVYGPRENRHRPSVDALFRSAARAYRSNVIAVVLSGALDDGVAGALAVKARDGMVIVQDPAQAQVPAMPANVMAHVKTDHCVPLEQIAPLLTALTAAGDPISNHNPSPEQCARLEQDERLGVTEPLAYTCPECGGSLLKLESAGVEQFRCNVGHVYTLDSFSVAHSHALERAIWTALQRLNEQRSIQEHLAKRAPDSTLRKRYQENAAAASEDMRLLKEILARL